MEAKSWAISSPEFSTLNFRDWRARKGSCGIGDTRPRMSSVSSARSGRVPRDDQPEDETSPIRQVRAVRLWIGGKEYMSLESPQPHWTDCHGL